MPAKLGVNYLARCDGYAYINLEAASRPRSHHALQLRAVITHPKDLPTGDSEASASASARLQTFQSPQSVARAAYTLVKNADQGLVSQKFGWLAGWLTDPQKVS